MDSGSWSRCHVHSVLPSLLGTVCRLHGGIRKDSSGLSCVPSGALRDPWSPAQPLPGPSLICPPHQLAWGWDHIVPSPPGVLGREQSLRAGP